jgi:hypothetical protein
MHLGEGAKGSKPLPPPPNPHPQSHKEDGEISLDSIESNVSPCAVSFILPPLPWGEGQGEGEEIGGIGVSPVLKIKVMRAIHKEREQCRKRERSGYWPPSPV